MKKRQILALLLAVMICLGQMPVVVRAAVSESDAQTYLNILDRTNPESSYLADFDGDGRDELVVAYRQNYNDYMLTLRIWKGDKVILDQEYFLSFTPR